MDRIFAAWLAEATLVRVFQLFQVIGLLPHQFFWDGIEHVDPAKEANAQATRLKNNTTTLAYEYARQGKDWEAELRQRAKEQKLMKELGLVGQQTTTKKPEEDGFITENRHTVVLGVPLPARFRPAIVLRIRNQRRSRERPFKRIGAFGPEYGPSVESSYIQK